MSTLFGQSLTQEQQIRAEWLRKNQRCTRCHSTFQAIDNYGTRLCYGLHASTEIVNGRHKCCRRLAPGDGCIPADHNDGRHSDAAVDRDAITDSLTNDDVLLIASIQKTDVKHLVQPTWRLQNAETGVWLICRIDYDARKRALNKSMLNQ